MKHIYRIKVHYYEGQSPRVMEVTSFNSLVQAVSSLNEQYNVSHYVVTMYEIYPEGVEMLTRSLRVINYWNSNPNENEDSLL